MKYIVTEQQIEDYKNSTKIQYTPEKIDEFISDAHKCVTYLKKIYHQYYQQLLALTIGDVMDDPDPVKQIMDKMSMESKYADKLATKYYNAIVMYEFGDYPDNVTQLDELYNVIEHLQSDLDNVRDIFESVYESVTHFKDWNQEKFK